MGERERRISGGREGTERKWDRERGEEGERERDRAYSGNRAEALKPQVLE
jgi:hypothetical protein